MRGNGMADHHENPFDTADRTPEAAHSRRTTTNDSSTNHSPPWRATTSAVASR